MSKKKSKRAKELSRKKFIFLEHTADIKFQAFGKTLNGAFANAALALSFYVSGNQKIAPKKRKVIEVSGSDNASLLYNFLDELIYLIDAEHFIVSKAFVLLKGNNLKAELYGDSTFNYKLEHVKAATYAEMEIKKSKNFWIVQFVLDV